MTRVDQPSLDGRDTLALELRADPRRVGHRAAGDSLTLRARRRERVPFTVRITTTGQALTPLARDEIFTPRSSLPRDAPAAGAPAPPTRHAARARLERQVRGVELLSSREKLMAGLPTYATYFGRDMLMTALMMRPIWRDEMSEFAIASALRKLGPRGDVSHEEALGGQAVREGAAEYAALVDRALAARGDAAGAEADSAARGARDRAARHAAHARELPHDRRRVPARGARRRAGSRDPAVPAARKRAFLLDTTDDGEPRAGAAAARARARRRG